MNHFSSNVPVPLWTGLSNIGCVNLCVASMRLIVLRLGFACVLTGGLSDSVQAHGVLTSVGGLFHESVGSLTTSKIITVLKTQKNITKKGYLLCPPTGWTHSTSAQNDICPEKSIRDRTPMKKLIELLHLKATKRQKGWIKSHTGLGFSGGAALARGRENIVNDLLLQSNTSQIHLNQRAKQPLRLHAF